MNWWQYLLLVNVYLVLFFGFYALLLRKETFFQLNRVYLVSAALLSFFIPVIQADWVKNLFITQTVHHSIYGGNALVIYQYKPMPNEPFSIGEILTALYFAGVLFLVIRLIWQLITLKRIMNQPQQNAAYTFFNTIRMDEQTAGNNIIAAHEQVHAKQWHSADVLIIEAVMIINWFNPVVYFYRYAVKHIHEFIADSHALKAGTSKADYALMLLTQTFNAPTNQLVNGFFNRGLLKQRIMMLQKNKSQRAALIKYGLSAPLFVLMLVLSSATVNNSKAVEKVNIIAQKVFNMPADSSLLSAGTPDSTAELTTGAKVITKENSTAVKGVTNASTLKKDNNITIDADTIAVDKAPVFSAVEVEPTFPGAAGEFGNFLARTIRYPAVDKDNKIQGRVIVTFIVEEDGSLSNVHVLRSPSQTLGDEAIRTISLSPKWNPGMQNGKKVRVQFTVPISFTLNDANDQTSGKKTGAIENNQTPNSPTNVVVVGYGTQKTDTNKRSVGVVLTKMTNGMYEPLYIVDGKEIKPDALKKIDPQNIESIAVLKEGSATSLYGKKGANGVVLITMKKQ